MPVFFKDFFKDVTDQAKKLLVPQKLLDWKTLVLLSLFSLLVAVAVESVAVESGDPNRASPFIINLLTTLSWMFFTTAVWWALAEHPIKPIGNFSISPWITGAVICFFVFQPDDRVRFRWALSTWPLISTGVMALPYCVGWDLELKKVKDKDIQQLIVTTLVTLTLTSWILFDFRVQDWVANYPTLMAKRFDQSAFVTDFGANSRRAPAQGVRLVEGTTNAIADELNGMPWYQSERWLFNREAHMDEISRRVKRTLDAPREEAFWHIFALSPRRAGEGYALTVQANWLGPVAEDDGFFYEKTCTIMPQAQVRDVPVAPEQPPQISQLTVVTCPTDTPVLKPIVARPAQPATVAPANRP